MPFILRKKEINQYGLEVVANNAYQHLKNAPKGRKAIFLAPWRGELNEMVREEPEDYIWWDNGINKLANLLDDFLTYYRRLGGDVDIVFGDIEAGTSIFYLEQKAIWPDPTEEIFDKIVKNPRYKTELRPALIEASKKIIDDRCKGYIFPTNPNMNELYWVYNYADASYDDGTIFNHIIFNYVMTEWNHIALNKAIFEPFKKHFPNIKYSNYNSFYIYKKYVPVDIYGSIGKYDTEEIVGTHGAPPIYGSNRRLRENPPPDYPFDFFYRTPFNGLLHDSHRINTILASSPDKKLMPWVAFYNWSRETANTYSYTDYYNESIFHVGLKNPDPFLFWNPHQLNAPDEDDILLSNLLHELDELVGYKDRKPIENVDVPWSRRYVLNGMTANKRTVWRLSPDISVPGLTIENFLVSEKPLKFQIANEVIQFPEGSYIYKPSKEYSAYGYWVISPLDTRPEEYYDDTVEPAPEPYEPASDAERKEIYSKTVQQPNDEKNELSVDKKRMFLYGIPEQDVDNDTEKIKTDISGHWAEKSILDLNAKEIMKGDGINFYPDQPVTRVEFLAMLERAMGIKEAEYHIEFEDVSSEAWYAGIVQTAVAIGLAHGNGNRFRPEDTLSRQELINILMNVYSLIAEQEQSKISDEKDIAALVFDALKEVYIHDLLSVGNREGFISNEITTRAESATVLIKIMEQIPEESMAFSGLE